MQLYDTAVLDGVRTTRDGYLVGNARIARTGIQLYSAGELGLKDRRPSDMIRVYRPPESVFDDAAMAGLAHRPVTNDHPTDDVTAENWRDLAVGMTGGEVQGTGKFVQVPLALMDQQAIDDYRAGKREFSVGYTCEIEMRDGQTPEGEAFDAVQSDIKPNHVALCRTARGGHDLRFGDNQGDRTMPEVKLQAVVVDGISYDVTDQGAQLIGRMQGLLADAGKALERANTDHASAIKAKDEELGKKDAELEELKGKIVDGAKLDALVADRADVLAKVKKLAPSLDSAGKATPDLKRAAVASKLGDDKVKDKSDDYVRALFDHLVAEDDDDENDAIRDAVRSGGGKAVGDEAKSARDAMLADLRGEKAAA